MEISLTVFFEDPFWVGVFEKTEGRKLSACKVTFGAEPQDNDIYALILSGYEKLVFGAPIERKIKQKADNPKRRVRNAKNRLNEKGVGTKAQQATEARYRSFRQLFSWHPVF